MRGFLLHPRVPGLTHRPNILPRISAVYPGCLPHPSFRFFIQTFSLLCGVFSFTQGCLPHPSSKYFTPHTSGLSRVSASPIHSDFLFRLSVFYAGFFPSPKGVCFTHRPNILPRISAVYPGCLVSPIVQKNQIKLSTAPGIPKRSPIQVLTGPDVV